VCFGPVLVTNGVPCDVVNSGVNPRTAIGQRSDGAVLLLVIDGRQTISLGATYQDLVDVFLEYGAVNACNLDGGSSTLMWFNGGYVNNCASLVGIRKVPSTFLVLKEGANDNG
jgi:exopolysaccharide biosynthesis protein